MAFINLTEDCKTFLQKFLVEGSHPPESTYVRVAIAGISCSGPRFSLYFDENFNSEHDELFEVSSLKVVTNRSNLDTLSGYTIDYKKNEQIAGFVFNNPLQAMGCSSKQGCCGGNSPCQSKEENI
jgi:iron-sulfur cluster assembly accessory protein